MIRDKQDKLAHYLLNTLNIVIKKRKYKSHEIIFDAVVYYIRRNRLL